MRPDGTTAQGYGWPHQRERARWAKVIEADGGTWCLADRCLESSRWIGAGEPWDLGHHPGQRGWRGPEHRKCNRADGAHKSNRTGNPGARYRKRPRRTVIHQDVSVDVADL